MKAPNLWSTLSVIGVAALGGVAFYIKTQCGGAGWLEFAEGAVGAAAVAVLHLYQKKPS